MENSSFAFLSEQSLNKQISYVGFWHFKFMQHKFQLPCSKHPIAGPTEDFELRMKAELKGNAVCFVLFFGINSHFGSLKKKRERQL